MEERALNYQRRPQDYIIFDSTDLDTSRIVRRPNYTQTPIKPPPEFFCLQYIGGPRNAQQEFLDYRQNITTIQDGGRYDTVCSEPLQLPSAERDTMMEIFHYKTVFIPLDQTLFSDAQIVIALFQP